MQNKRILIVDDDQSMLKMLSTFFEKAGYDVISQNNGKLAFGMLESDQFDVVITDLMLDGVSGFDVLQKTKQYSPHTEVVVITGHSSIDSAVRAMREGAFDYITKPIALEELSIVIEKAFERRSFLTEIRHLRDQVKQYTHFDNIQGGVDAVRPLRGHRPGHRPGAADVDDGPRHREGGEDEQHGKVDDAQHDAGRGQPGSAHLAPGVLDAPLGDGAEHDGDDGRDEGQA